MTAFQKRRSPAGTGLQNTSSNATGGRTQYSRPIDILLPRLDGVQKAGTGWRALCPACGGKSRKLSIGEADDGRVLLHCFAGCAALDVVHAVGLELGDLFPERIKDPSPEGRRAASEAFKRSSWAAALGVLGREAYIVEIAAHDLADGKPLAEADHARLVTACQRIHAAREVLT